MNTVSPTKKEAVLKSFAVAGFIGIIILIAWLSVQIVSLAPSAFSSLASIAEGINQYKETIVIEETTEPLTISSDVAVQDSGQPVVLSWNRPTAPGVYTFSYECLDGVAIDIVESDGLRSIACNTSYNLGDTSGITMIVDSEKVRRIDVSYTIAYLQTSDTALYQSQNSLVTITNESVAESGPSETPIQTDEAPIVTEAATTTPEVVVSNPNPPAPPKPTPTYTYAIPVSNPNGKTDLATRFLAVGEIKNNVFISGVLEKNNNGALQFEVKNLGTKTSNSWTYVVSLPDDESYTSSSQNPLKPNERAVISIGFPATNETSHTFKVKISTTQDSVALNNNFSRTLLFVN